MDAQIRTLIQRIIDTHRTLTLATLRPDGWPQATTVGYAGEGLTLYFLCGADSQKAANIAACNKVSLTIDDDVDDIPKLQGLSMAATAAFVTDPADCSRIFRMLIAKYPAAKDWPEPAQGTVRYVRLTPKVISVLDYAKGFGHADLVEVTPADMARAA
ncbi:MAG: pyridoxamine 5'-phosphate oxidase family protein [Hydrogenophilaceae bacterium]|jgi:nitroimidazol reductase NimA-like FMN-containing flavoprotein (pyridoxamine 5'-phosphate oxidase superfamily)|nr:pyridoxamine 5'-phosphate oxidase family protein [Hydrogenophilaceae bacterium]